MMHQHDQAPHGGHEGRNDNLLRQKRFALVLSGDIGVADGLIARLSMIEGATTGAHLSPSAKQFYSFKKLYDMWMGEVQGTSRETPLFQPGHEHEAIQRGLDPSIAKRMGELPSLHRVLLLLIYGENFSYAASAQLLNITVEQLMSALAAARQKFSTAEDLPDIKRPPQYVASQEEGAYDAAR